MTRVDIGKLETEILEHIELWKRDRELYESSIAESAKIIENMSMELFKLTIDLQNLRDDYCELKSRID